LGATSFKVLGGIVAAAAASSSLLLYAAVRFLVVSTPASNALLVAVLSASFSLTIVETLASTFVLLSTILLLYVAESPNALDTIETIPCSASSF
jgi:hypothetical protein